MRLRSLAAFAAAVASCLVGGAARAEDDPTFAANVRAWTTKPEFMSPLVDHLPAGGAVPSPRQALGQDIGAPKVLHRYADIVGYYRALAARSGRVKIIETGATEEGRPTVVVLISSEETLANLEANKRNTRRLADPRGLSEEEAKRLIAETKPIYLALGGLHSAETGPPEMLMELAYRLVTEDTPLIRQIRDRIIVGINPASDPDGRDRYTDWYYRHKLDETDDQDRVPGPPYWGKYIFHDNNRDINYTGYSARNLLKFYLEWKPTVVHDLHESVPFLYIYSGQPPQNSTLDPIMFSELPWFANFEMAQLKKYGMPGVWDFGYVDAWSPGYVAFMASNHNGLIRMYETFGNGGANTMLRHVKPVVGPGQPAGGGRDFTKREWFRPDPPYETVDWSMRNNTNYMETGLLTALQTASTFPQQLLENFARKSRNAVEAGRAKPPHAFVIPADQPDMTRAAWIVDILRLQGVEVGRATGPVQLKEGSFPAGSLVVKTDQPYGRLAKILLEKQDYPDPKLRTYDDSAWTLGLMARTRVVASADPKALAIPVEAVDRYAPPAPAAEAGAAAYAVPDRGSPNLFALRQALKGVDVRIAEAEVPAGGRTLPKGSFLVPASAYARLKAAAQPLGLEVTALPAAPAVAAHAAAMPRTAVFSTWGATQNVGWVRYALDQFKAPYDLVFKEQVRAGGLRRRYDVIVIPSQGSAKDTVFDLPVRGKPLDYRASADARTLGAYGSSPDIRGGMGLEGVTELKRFVEEGGLLITLGDASALPAEFGLAPDVEASRPSREFYAPGPIVKARILAPDHPLFYGYDDKAPPVRWASTALLSLPDRARGEVLMDFPGGAANVLSGLMVNPDETKDRPAVVSEAVGRGRILMFATNPLHRWQTFGEFRMLFNALMNYDRLGGGAPPRAAATSASAPPAAEPHPETSPTP